MAFNHKRFIIYGILVFLTSITSFSIRAQEKPKVSEGSQKIAQLKYPELNWKVPEIGREVDTLTLANGMKLFLLPDTTLPIFNIQALIRTGSIYEPVEMMGVANLTGIVMRTGGTENLTPDSLNQMLEFMAGSVETAIGTEAGSASLNILSKDIEQGLTLFADVLRHPLFRQDKIDLAKDQIKESIRRRNDQPGSIVSREFNHLVYGDHPYGRTQEWETVKKVTREDLLSFYKKYFHPNNMMLGISGDFKKAEIFAQLSRVFGDWKPEKIDFPPIPKVQNKPSPGVYVIQKDINQSNIVMGHLGIDWNNPDNYAISVMNFILGGGSFTSRMTSRVRSDEGLAYSVGTSFGAGRDLGTFSASCQTKTATTHRAMSLMVDEIKRIRETPVQDEELTSAKDAFINRYVFGFTSPAQVVGQLMNLEFFDRPRDYLKTYLDNIRKVTKPDIQRVAQKYLKPKELTIVVVGNTPQFSGQLNALGRVMEIPLTPPKVD